jgi:ribosomal protein L16/L10AE
MKILKEHKQLNIYKEKRKIASTVKEGILGLKSLGTKQITSYQIESARRCISRLTKRNSKL